MTRITVTSYGYDAGSRLASLGHVFNGSNYWDVTTGFSYNPAGQIASSTRSHDGYAWTGHWNRDMAEAPNGLNQLVSQGAAALTWDARGNLWTAGGISYSYTSENRLTGQAGVGVDR